MSAGDPKEGRPSPAPHGPLLARAFLGMGSNIEPRKNVIRALQMLAASDGVHLSGISTFYRTPALSGAYPDFLNGVLEVRTSLQREEMVELLDRIEEALGRIRLPDRYAPRTMDLDLLLYLPARALAGGPREVPGEDRSEEVGAEDPHPDVFSRPFVALPLLELEPDLTLPPHGRPLAEVAAAFPDPGGKAEAGLTTDLRSRFLPE